MAALYQQLCPVLFGDNAVGEMAKQIAEKGYKHVFICCDAGVRKAGIVELVENALKEEGLAYSMYDEILPDTPDTVVDELAAKIAQTGEILYWLWAAVPRWMLQKQPASFLITETRSANIWKKTETRDS